MLWSTVVFAAVQCATVFAHSTSFADASTGIVFQRVETGSDGSSVAIALPPQGAAASDAIIQLTGPVSQSFAGVSPSPSLIHGNFRQPMFGARALESHTVGNVDKAATFEPVLTQIAEPEITESTFKVTFRCQNCTFTETKGSKFTTLTAISSNSEVSSISDPNFKINSNTDVIRDVEFDLKAARVDNYWSIIDRL